MTCDDMTFYLSLRAKVAARLVASKGSLLLQSSNFLSLMPATKAQTPCFHEIVCPGSQLTFFSITPIEVFVII